GNFRGRGKLPAFGSRVILILDGPCSQLACAYVFVPQTNGLLRRRHRSLPEGDPMSKKYTRLTTPLVRENGVLREATWDEALDRAAEGFRAAVEANGAQAFGLFSCSKATNEVNYLAQKFARQVIGSNNIDSCNRTGHAPPAVVLTT